MAIVMEAASSQITEPQGFDYLAELRYGGNGDLWGSPELDAGEVYGDVATARAVWDQDVFDGIETGWMDVELIVSGSGIQWTVDGQQVSFTPIGLGSIGGVAIRAAADTQAFMGWSDLDVKFYSGNTQIDSYASTSGPTVDQDEDPYAGESEKTLTIMSQGGAASSVHISAKVKMSCPEGVYLNENSVFGQILISTGAA